MQIKTYQPEDHKIKALIYGSSGAGKTSFGGTAKNALFLSAENGLLSIKHTKPKFININSLKDLREAYLYLRDENHDFEVVIIDSITEISNIIKEGIETKYNRVMQIQDWGELKKELIKLFKAFRDLPMHVIVIAQDDRIVDEDKIHRIVPSVDGKGAVAVLPCHMDIVGYAHIENGEHKIHTLPNRKFVTKDRSRMIGNDCPPDFEEWKKRVSTIKTGKQKVEVEFKSGIDMADKLIQLLKDFYDLNKEDESITIINDKLGTKFKSLDSMTEEQIKKAYDKLTIN